MAARRPHTPLQRMATDTATLYCCDDSQPNSIDSGEILRGLRSRRVVSVTGQVRAKALRCGAFRCGGITLVRNATRRQCGCGSATELRSKHTNHRKQWNCDRCDHSSGRERELCRHPGSGTRRAPAGAERSADGAVRVLKILLSAQHKRVLMSARLSRSSSTSPIGIRSPPRPHAHVYVSEGRLTDENSEGMDDGCR
jgi:hypothetical protein